jgi:hypothetical protein
MKTRKKTTRMGRPPGDPADVKRHQPVKFSDNDMAKIKAACQKLGVQVAPQIHKLTMNWAKRQL